MSESKKAKYRKLANEGLASANRGNPFWSQSEAMSLINLIRRNA